jgi:hypothetical protein
MSDHGAAGGASTGVRRSRIADYAESTTPPEPVPTPLDGVATFPISYRECFTQDDQESLEVFGEWPESEEVATRMSVSSTGTAKSILIEFEFSECRGTLRIDASPDFRITDHLLLT